MQSNSKNIKYPYLPTGRTILYVEENNPYMLEAKKTCKEQATDFGHSSGAVVVKNGKIIGQGALQSRLKNKKLIKLHARGWCIRKILKIKSGKKYWLCPGCADFDHHSEAMAVKNALKNKIDMSGSDIYLWGHWWCCKSCWDKMIKAGIKNVYLLEDSDNIFK